MKGLGENGDRRRVSRIREKTRHHDAETSGIWCGANSVGLGGSGVGLKDGASVAVENIVGPLYH